ncbi:Centlein [Holothuria leucospilota]|uniref:Centlein n=1 Tax=Holothuria leucospilota TaxID=206669 RepID=A0A9Q1BN97_HOLLE|nr:Centlein [Holothuria leucospilota]
MNATSGGFDSAEDVADDVKSLSKDTELAKLRAENQSLQQDLIQCKTDKEFVWSLWKRLQVANPDVTQAISMVLQREKEKTEMKDRKVLEILHIKDDRIAELDKILNNQAEGTKEQLKRIEELQNTKDLLEKGLEEKNVEIVIWNQEKEKLEAALADARTGSNTEIRQLKEENNKLSLENKELSEIIEQHKLELSAIEDKNAMLMDKIKEMEKDIHGIGISAEEAAEEHSRAAVQLGQAEQNLTQWKRRAAIAEEELDKLKKKHAELRRNYQQTLDHTSQQLQVITQLQTLQAETQSMLKNQENAHLIEASNYQAVNKELQRRFEAVKTSEEALKKVIAERKQQEEVSVITADAEVQVGSVREEVKGHISNEDEQPWVERYSPNRLTSADVEDTVKKSSLTDAIKRGVSEISSSPSRAYFSIDDELVRKYKISSVASKQVEDSHLEQKVKDLKKLLLLKEEELAQVRQSHDGRLSRLKSLQSAYSVLKEQITTYEEHERKLKAKKTPHRAAPKALQKENSDAVWNELTYYKQRTADLIQEKMKLQEEIDQLRVQTATDATTMEELTQCLEEDKKELQSQMRRMKELKKSEENERKKAKSLTLEVNDLRRTSAELEESNAIIKKRLTDAEHEARMYRAECSKLESEVTVNQSKSETLQIKVDRLKKSLIRMRRKKHSLVAERQTADCHRENEEKLNRTLEAMSQILPDNDSQNWSDVRSQSDDGQSPFQQRLSPRVSTSTPRKHRSAGRRHIRASTWSATSRQILSVQKHLTRMARAYEEDEVRETILKQASTQTDGDFNGPEEFPKRRLFDVGVGNVDINDEMSTNTSEDSQTSSSILPMGKPLISEKFYSHEAGASKPLHKIQLSPGVKHKTSVKTLQKRINSLQQQVSLLKETKNALQKSFKELKETDEKLQSDYKLVAHQLQTNRQTVQRLSRELESSRTECALYKNELTQIQSQKHEEKKSAMSTKQMEDRLKTQSQEMGRQSSLIKSLKEQNEEQETTIQTLQDKLKKLDKDFSQKRSLIEDLRSKVKAREQEKMSIREELESEENKMKKLKEDIAYKKTEIDSLKKQLIVAKKEKESYENRWNQAKHDLEKQKSLVELSRSRQQEAERSLDQLEALAAEQLQSLTHQTEDALKGARKELKVLKSRQVELKGVIKELAKEVSKETQVPVRLPPPDTDPLSIREQSLASSILNLSAEDWQGFLGDEESDISKGEKDLTDDFKKLNELLESKVCIFLFADVLI